MKTLKNILCLVCLFIFFNSAYATRIDSLKIIPPNPTNTDIVKVVCYVEFGSTPCKLDSSAVTIDNNEITVAAKHSGGFANAMCYSIDTISIGFLATGEYNLTYQVERSQRADTASFSFTVSETSSVRDKNIEQKISIYPNPATSELNISGIANTNYTIQDMSGRAIQNGFFENSINVSELKQGIYILTISTENQNYIHRVVKN